MPTKHRPFALAPAAALGVAVALAALLLGLGATPLAVGLVAPPWDKALHFSAYFGIGCFVAAGTGRRPRLLAFALTFALGAVDESLQFFEPGRHPELEDLLADATGAWCAAFFSRPLLGLVHAA